MDLQKLSQVFVNLLNNACEASENQNGKITIKAALINGQIHIQIKDNGLDIAKEKADKIFYSFFTTKDKNQGTGLVLFIVHTIIEEHQGGISLSACNGKRAEFKIILPSA